MIRAAVLYAAAMLGTALTSQTYLAIVLLIVVGAASIIFLTIGTARSRSQPVPTCAAA